MELTAFLPSDIIIDVIVAVVDDAAVDNSGLTIYTTCK